MAQVCYKPAGSCKTCEFYKYDKEDDRMACFKSEERTVSDKIRELVWLKENRPAEFEVLMNQTQKKEA